MRKRNSNAKLFSLPEKSQRDIFALGESMSVKEACAKIALPIEMGGYEVEVCEATLSNFLAEWRTELAIEKHREQIRERARMSEAVTHELDDSQRDGIDTMTMDSLRAWVSRSIMDQELSAKEVKAFMGILQKNRAQDLEERKVALLEQKAAFVDEMKDRAANREGGLTPEDMEEIERKLKLL
ncbi:MAG: hypothetical protein EA353_03775 [Puniceicoccaceae bacterium]|nr:MAG: hypothetical protein EA353_03775 [Puniceicoccaceae bacterium]